MIDVGLRRTERRLLEKTESFRSIDRRGACWLPIRNGEACSAQQSEPGAPIHGIRLLLSTGRRAVFPASPRIRLNTGPATNERQGFSTMCDQGAAQGTGG